MTKVYVVQQQKRRDPASLKMVDMYDLSPAEDFGELVFVLPPEALPFRPKLSIEIMHDVLKDFKKDDYILLIGNPAFIGWATTIASHYSGGSVRQLQWNGRERRYTPLDVHIFP